MPLRVPIPILALSPSTAAGNAARPLTAPAAATLDGEETTRLSAAQP